MSSAVSRLGPVSSSGGILYDPGTADPAALVAAEQIVHLMDGWKYASAAVSSCLMNSRSAAVHFSYYAELRAAMSLFASSGIRVNQDESFFLDSAGSKHDVRGDTRTHSLTWALWKEWIKRPDAIELLTRDVKLIAGVSLGDFSGASTVATFALRHWGYDLFQVADDRHARNLASYIPAISTPVVAMADSEAEFVKKLWALLLPTEHGVGFDTALIKFLVTRAAQNLHAAENSQPVQHYLDGIVDDASRRTGAEASVIRSLIFNSSIDVMPFELASQSSSDVTNVISRALFLLRIGVLALEKNIAQDTTKSAGAWIRSVLAKGGIYEDEGIDPRDLSIDYSVAQSDFFTKTTTVPHCLVDPDEPNLRSTSRLMRPDAFMAWAVTI